MIQRIQTLYMMISVIIAITALFLSVITVETAAGIYEVTPLLFNAPEELLGGWPLALLWAVFILLTAGAIAGYKDRIKQMKLLKYTYFTALLIVLFETTLIYFWRTGSADIVNVDYGSHLIMPFIAFLFNFMAKKRIEKDEDLVRSVDRLR